MWESRKNTHSARSHKKETRKKKPKPFDCFFVFFTRSFCFPFSLGFDCGAKVLKDIQKINVCSISLGSVFIYGMQ